MTFERSWPWEEQSLSNSHSSLVDKNHNFVTELKQDSSSKAILFPTKLKSCKISIIPF